MSAPQPLIDYGRMLDVLGIEAELLLDTAARVSPELREAVVPGCPGLTLTETVRHVGGVYQKVRLWVQDGRSEPQQWQRAPLDDDLIGFVRSGLGELVTELARHDPEAPCDTWWPQHRSYGFWRRRMMHETTVHRVDVQASAGGPVHPIGEDVALDGIDELLFLWFGHRLNQLRMSSPQQGAVALSAGERRWLAIFERDGSSARRVSDSEARAADAMVSGGPTEVYLWSWGRLPDQSVRISGDLEAVGQLWTLLRPATQSLA